jgi:hypothetical protein
VIKNRISPNNEDALGRVANILIFKLGKHPRSLENGLSREELFSRGGGFLFPPDITEIRDKAFWSLGTPNYIPDLQSCLFH